MGDSENSVWSAGGILPRAILVDEMGFLAELYAHADWAYVGGGFGSGIHSTLEPAAAGIPICCGPARVDVFAETRGLRKSAQLTVIEDASGFASWIDRVDHLSATQKRTWKDDVSARLGATERIWSEIQSASGSSHLRKFRETDPQ